jgi:hypothetical protein
VKQLRISEDLALPLDTVTSTLIAYGGKGMGKTNLGSVLVEELTRCGLRWAWLDPLGVSWGLRHSADGAGRGVECLILGGLHGDVPIEPAGGAAVADVVVEESTNVLIDFSRKRSGEMWSIAEKIRFVSDYALRLFQRQGEIISGRRRPPLFQVLDEAARYIPQTIPAGEPKLAECVGAWNQLVEEGRNVGLGVGLLTQRSARMNKSVSELADAMFAFRTVGPNSLTAVLDWLGEHVEKKHIGELAATVRSLDRGKALVVSPGWLRFEGVVTIRMRETFDSSATVKHGEQQRTARGEGAKPDLARIRERMAATIERAKADDPRELRRALAEARAQIVKLQQAKPAPATAVKVPRVIEKPVLKDAVVKRLEAVGRKTEADLGHVGRHLATLAHAHTQLAEQIRAALAAARTGGAHDVTSSAAAGRDRGVTPNHAAPAGASRPAPVARPRQAAPSNGHGDGLTGPEQKVLDELASLEALGITSPPKAQVSVLCGYANPRSGGFSGPLGRLAAAGLITYPRSGEVALTDAGRARAQAPDAPLTNAVLHERVLDKFDGPRARILREVIAAYPQALDKAELGLKLGYQNPRSGGYSGPLGTLSKLGLIRYPTSGQVAATDLLFPEGAE